MNVIRQAIRDDIVGQILDVVLRTGFRARAAVARDAEDGGLAAKMGEERCNANLSCSGIAAGIGNTSGACNGATGNEFREAVGPIGGEAIIGREVYDESRIVADGINGLDIRLTDT